MGLWYKETYLAHQDAAVDALIHGCRTLRPTVTWGSELLAEESAAALPLHGVLRVAWDRLHGGSAPTAETKRARARRQVWEGREGVLGRARWLHGRRVRGIVGHGFERHVVPLEAVVYGACGLLERPLVAVDVGAADFQLVAALVEVADPVVLGAHVAVAAFAHLERAQVVFATDGSAAGTAGDFPAERAIAVGAKGARASDG